MYVPDNYDQWKHHDQQQQQKLAERPVCDYCDNPIQDDLYFEINGDKICKHCMETYFTRRVEE